MYSSADICSTSTLDKEDGSAVMTMNKYRLGIDIGSTTVKIAILDDDNNILFSDYERHFANIQETLQGLLEKAVSQLGQFEVYPVITGSGGLTLAKHLEVPLHRRLSLYQQHFRITLHSAMLPLSLVARMQRLSTSQTVLTSV